MERYGAWRNAIIKSLVVETSWTLKKNLLEKIFRDLDKTEISKILSTPCRCVANKKPSCGGLVNQSQLYDLKMTKIVAEKQKYDVLSLILRQSNESGRTQFARGEKNKPRVIYKIGSTEVCCDFYERALKLAHSSQSNVYNEVIGNQEHKLNQKKTHIKKRLPTYKKKLTGFDKCVAFWEDFFNTLCPSPVKGLLLWPGAMSRKSIYALDFVAWWKRTRQTPSEDMLPPTPQKDPKTPQPPRAPQKLKKVSPFDPTTSYQLLFNLDSDGGDELPAPDTRPSAAWKNGRRSMSVVSSDEEQKVAEAKHNPAEDECASDSDRGNKCHVLPELLGELPSFSVFCKARWHGWFKEVKERAKHFHARCATCSTLLNSCRKGL